MPASVYIRRNRLTEVDTPNAALNATVLAFNDKPIYYLNLVGLVAQNICSGVNSFLVCQWPLPHLILSTAFIPPLLAALRSRRIRGTDVCKIDAASYRDHWPYLLEFGEL